MIENGNRIPKPMVKVIFDEGITRIDVPRNRDGWEVFPNDTLCEAVLPSTARQMEFGIFRNCTNLKRINIPEGLPLQLDDFKGSNKLERVVAQNPQTEDFFYSRIKNDNLDFQLLSPEEWQAFMAKQFALQNGIIEAESERKTQISLSGIRSAIDNSQER